MRPLFLIAALAVWGLAQAASAAPVALAPIAISPALQADIDNNLGAREGPYLEHTVVEQVTSALAREGGQVSEKRQKEISQIRIDMLPGGRGVSHLRAQFEQPLLILMGVVGLVLAIACGNLANFLLSKSASREREFSTRLALGASNGRIARQILTEALVLSGIGGLLGLAVAFWGMRVLVGFVIAGAKHTAIDTSPMAGAPILSCALFVLLATRASRLGGRAIRVASRDEASIRRHSATLCGRSAEETASAASMPSRKPRL